MQTLVPALKSVHDRFIVYALLVVAAMIPLQMPLGTWLGDQFGGVLAFRLLPDAVLALGAIIALLFAVKKTAIRRKIWQSTLARVAAAFTLLHIALLLMLRPDIDAAVAGVIINLRFVGVLLIAMYLREVVSKSHKKIIVSTIGRVLIGGAVFVVVFGVLQAVVLPDDFLRFFGYSAETTPPFITLDNDPSIIRLQSTLRGPNPLGAYLILPTLFFVYNAHKRRSWRWALLSVGALLVMYGTFSRSGWLGLGGAAGVLGFLEIKNKGTLLKGIVAMIIAGGVSLLVLANVASQETFNRIIFHDESGQILTESNQEHIDSIITSTGDIIRDPIGDGPGTAGPASFHNDDVTRISENYFLQIGQEVGVAGLVLFVLSIAMISQQIYQEGHRYAPVMLASIAGLAIVNIFSHGWADPAVVYSWWIGAVTIAFLDHSS